MTFVKTHLLTFKTQVENLNMKSGSGHVTPTRSPFAVNVDLKVSISAHEYAAVSL